MSFYADIVLPLPLDMLFTYEVETSMKEEAKVGCRVVVQFGKKKFYTGIVVRLYEAEPKDNIKPIESILENYPIVLPTQLRFWEWISSYYMCPMGDVYKAAVPASFKLESKTYVCLNDDYELGEQLSEKERQVFNGLTTKPITLDELAKQIQLPNVVPYVKSLVDKGVAYLSEDVRNGYVAKTESAVRLAKAFTEEELHALLDGLTRAKKQHELLLVFLELKEKQETISKKELLAQADTSTSVLNELIKKNILATYAIQISRFDYGETNLEASNTLNVYQQKAYEEIQNSFFEKDVSLLFGVTSSGKTEIYIQLIKDAIATGEQVLYLLPEIALTTQITDRLKQVFGNKLAVYHSKFNDNERADIWKELLAGDEVQVVLGARSAVFLPFTKLGLVIVDEEHEGSYKQQDPAPRYNARNAAIMLAGMSRAKTLLGTATPSMETYTNALAGRYGLIRLTQRHQDIELPAISIVNTKELRRTKQMKSILSPPLVDKMQEALAKDEQVILFQNRRGFSSLLECKTCSWTPTCEHCDVSLTYHKLQGVMICHYCGATYSIPTECPDCKTPTLEVLGYGTERIEEEVRELFPEVATARMDMDTTRGKRSYEKLIADFEAGRTQILIGTQMVSKGLDFDNVSVVGVLNADNLLNFPDFRAHEKAFQLLVQVSGRAGRKHKQGAVLIQTSHPGHPLMSYIRNNDYESFFQLQAGERKLFQYPPYYRLIEVTIKSRYENVVDQAARYLAQGLKQSFGGRVLGPTKPAIGRIQSLHLRKILLKIEHAAPIAQVRQALVHYQQNLQTNPSFKSVLMQYDVDPM